MACALCGADACLGHTSNRTMPAGYGWFGPEPGPPTGPNRGYPRIYQGVQGMYTATERLYLDADGNVVKADDPARQSLLIGVGQTMPDERARELGLLDTPEQDAAAEEKAAAPKSNKAKAAAPENKAAKG